MSIRLLKIALLVSLATAASATLASADPSDHPGRGRGRGPETREEREERLRYRRDAYGDTAEIVRRAEDAADALKSDVNDALDNSRLNGTSREDRINAEVKQLEDAVDRIHDDFGTAGTADRYGDDHHDGDRDDDRRRTYGRYDDDHRGTSVNSADMRRDVRAALAQERDVQRVLGGRYLGRQVQADLQRLDAELRRLARIYQAYDYQR